MTPTKERPTKSGRNPVGASGYHTQDPRDRQREEREGSRVRCLYFDVKASERGPIGQLEAYVTALAEVSAEKPRWQKIIEHANTLAGELEMPLEDFYATALIEFIEKTKNLRIAEELTEAYKNIDQQKENVFLNHLVSHYDPRLADE